MALEDDSPDPLVRKMVSEVVFSRSGHNLPSRCLALRAVVRVATTAAMARIADVTPKAVARVSLSDIIL